MPCVAWYSICVENELRSRVLTLYPYPSPRIPLTRGESLRSLRVADKGRMVTRGERGKRSV